MAETRIIYVKNKNGTTYVCEDTAFWNKEKKMPYHKRKTIGKLGPDGEVIYNEKYNARKEIEVLKSKDESLSPEVTRTTLVGQRMVLDKCSSELHLPKMLKSVFGKEVSDKILALAYYIICRGKALSNSADWLADRGYADLGITSQRVSELLKEITPDRRNTFFASWIKASAKSDAVLFDISSISTYGRNLYNAEWGYNRDRESLEQINISLLTTRTSNIPLWYDILPGSMSDVAVLTNTIRTVSKLGLGSVPFVQDRGFYSAENLEMLKKNGIKFMIPIPSGVNLSKEIIAANKDLMVSPENAVVLENEHVIYGKTIFRNTEYGRTWFHIYYDPMRKEQTLAGFMMKLRKCMDELLENKPRDGHKSLYDKYFIIKDTPKKGRRVEYNHEAIQEYMNSEVCYWVLMTTFEKEATAAYFTYRDRNDDELHFDDFKNAMDLCRLRCHSDEAVQGKIFIHFIALAILSRLRKSVKAIAPKERLYMNESEMLSKVESYTRVHFEGKYKDVYSTPTKMQRKIFGLLGIAYDNKGVVVKPLTTECDMQNEDQNPIEQELTNITDQGQ